MPKQTITSVDQLRDDICNADAKQLEFLKDDPDFKEAVNSIGLEEWTNLPESVSAALVAHVDIQSELLAEVACWLSSSAPTHQRLEKKVIKKWIDENGDTPNQREWISARLSARYSFIHPLSHKKVMENFAQACEEEHNQQQAQRISAQLPAAAPARRKL